MTIHADPTDEAGAGVVPKALAAAIASAGRAACGSEYPVTGWKKPPR